jgi:hypothetical protein
MACNTCQLKNVVDNVCRIEYTCFVFDMENEMKSPAWLTGYVESLDIPALGRYRSDCPVCGKSNTFSVTDDGLQRLWFCFHADCNVKGRTGVTLTKDFAKYALSKKVEPTKPVDNNFQTPDTFVSLSRSLDAELYVRSVSAYDAYLSGRADIQYDFKRNRVVYMVKDGKRLVDAAGRAIDGRKPKWYRYGNSKQPFICGSGDTCFVVEDCASSCAISNLTTGMALLGTNLLPEHVCLLQNYRKVFVALDKDATDKALDMVRTLHNKVNTKLVILTQDLKNMKGDERDEFIRQYID